MKRTLAGLVVAMMLAGGSVPARAAIETEPVGTTDWTLAVQAALLNIGYLPLKTWIAVGGLVGGGLVGLFTGGDTRAAYSLWVPAAGGDFFITPSHLDGSRQLQFFGTDYADQPSYTAGDTPGRSVYDALYGYERPSRRKLTDSSQE